MQDQRHKSCNQLGAASVQQGRDSRTVVGTKPWGTKLGPA